MKYKLLRLSLIAFVAMLWGTAFADEVTMKYSGGTTTSMTGGNDAALLGLDATEWSVVGDKGHQDYMPGLNKDGGIRIYHHVNGGATVTVSSLTGATINNIKMSFKPDFENASVTVDGQTVTAKDGIWTINSTSFVIGNGNTNSTQVRVTEVIINYTPATGEVDTRTATTVTVGSDQSGVVGSSMNLPVAVVNDAAGAAIQGATVEWSSSNEQVAKIDGTVLNLLAVGESTITATFAGDNSYKGSQGSFKVTVINDPNTPGSEQQPYTVAQARAAIDAQSGITGVYAKGIVSEIVTAFNSQYGNITYNISEDGTTTADQLQVYRGKSYQGAKFTSADDIQVGDEVVIYGNLTKYNTTYEFAQDSYLVSLKRAEDLRTETFLTIEGVDEAGVAGEVGGFMNLPTATLHDTTGSPISNVTIEWTSSNEDVATIANGVISFMGKGTTTITATFAGDDNYKKSEASFKLTVTKPVSIEDGVFDFDMGVDYGSGLEKSNVQEQESTWTAGNVTMTLEGRNCWNDFGSGDNVKGQVRLYPVSGNNPAGTLTLAVPEGKVITNIVFTGATLANMGTETGKYTEGTWTGSANSVTFTATARTDIYTITVTYEDETVEPVWAWADIYADFTNQSFFTEADKDDATAGLKMNADGTFTRVAADDVTANAIISGKYHSDDHGISNFSASVKVEGPVKITFGTCAWGGNVTVKDASGAEVVPTFTTNTGACYHQNKEANVVSAYYKGEATTLTIAGGSYVPYFSVVAVDPADIPHDAKVTFDIANVECEGVAPAEITAEIGSTITIPANRTLYKADCTLTAWTDGERNQYKPGDELTISADLTLTPVFTENNIEDPQLGETFTAVWDFQQKNGAPVLNYQNKTGIYVTQVDFGGYIIDLKLDFDTNNGGKIDNGSWQDWCQMNNGTKLTIPAQKGMTVSVESYSATTTTTFDGSTDYTTEGNVVTYTYGGSSKSIDIVIGNGSYFRYVKAVYPTAAEPEFVDIKADFTNQSFFTEADKNGATAGLKMNADGTFTRVAADDDTANAIISGKFHSDQHGISNFSATVAVFGPVKISFGTCAWGGDVTVKNLEGETVATMNTNTGVCYDQDKENNIVSTFYKLDVPTVLTISGGAYVPYFAVEEVDPADIPSDCTISFDVANSGAQGVAPAEEIVGIGKKYTLPKNFTLYKEGFTLTGWATESATYAPGEEITVPDAESITLFPVFTENEVSLADRTEAVTVKWNFRRDAGAPTVAWEGKDGLVWVAQAEVAGKTIDVALPFSTNPGKFANGNWSDWAQLNQGTTFHVPSCKGATISMEAYNEITTTTIDSQTDYTSGKTISYTIGGAAESVDVVIGDGSYYRYIQVVLPVVQSQGGGESFDQVAGTINWPVGDEQAPTISADIAAAISSASVSAGSDLTISTANYFDTEMVHYTPKNSNAGNVEGVMIEYRVKPAKGVTFQPTQIDYAAVKVGTDNATYSWSYTVDGEESTITQIDPKPNLLRNNGSNSVENGGTAKLMHTETFTNVDPCEEFTFRFYISACANNKNICIGNVTISGIVNGKAVSVNMYELATVVAPEEAGSINVYPVAEQYEEGSEVTLTAIENFGYDFVNWTNAAGEEVSTEAKFKYTVASNETLTANFVAVETYELTLAVDGTNDYMVTISPEPTMVDGKMMYEDGTTVQLNANQYEGLVTFTNWSDGETASSKLVSMTEDIQLTAMYAQADIIAGWDFYTAGGNGRKADFYAQDNDGDALNLVNTETGETSGWLDKSWLGAGGYESFKGAAVNWRTGSGNGDVGHWHWQTKVNAEAFTDINVQFQMLYNYNAYQTYDAEFSLDGENWTKFGSITMSGTKAPATFSEQMPAEANNQAELYIRMLPDKTSNVDGAASANDGNTLAMFFITGSPKLVDDGVAPVLVSTVPADGATGVSATGKIVLTFDERVKLAVPTDLQSGVSPTGYINDVRVNSNMQNPVTPVVSGKTVTFEYKGLEYGTEYAFRLPGSSIADLTNNFFEDEITLTFTTMERPSVEKKLYDYVVENVDDLVAAIAAAQARADKNTRYRIFIKDGNYTIPLKENSLVAKAEGYEVPECITFINTQNLSIIGESRDGVIITNGIDPTDLFNGQYGKTSKYDGIGNSDVFQISGSDYYFQDLTIESGMADATGRDLAVQDKATRTIYKNTGLRGYQDTWTSNNDNGLYYFEDGYVRGRTDYMCGKGDAFFNGVELRQIAGGYAAVPSKSIKYGFTYKDCTINGEPATVNYATGETRTATQADGNYTLGRPWGSGTPVALFIDTRMNVVPSAIGWNEMSNGWPKRFAEYNSMTSTGSQIDLSGRKKVFGEGHENNPVLTAEEALEAGNLHNMFGEWDPTLATEQAPIPTNVKINKDTKELTWDNSNYALLFAIVKDGKVIDFTLENSYTVDDATAAYAVRAANEMGGLSEASITAAITTAISEVANGEQTVPETVYNINGIRVQKAQKGLYIINGKKVVMK